MIKKIQIKILNLVKNLNLLKIYLKIMIYNKNNKNIKN